ncbi:IS66 family insertion sequence element accessory protein TnpB [Pseudomonas salmasensis]|nr:IS66 family insertion sequence element accessory protein TnpB [Pseudomonas salmasensis]
MPSRKIYFYPKPVDFRKSIDGLAALVVLDIKIAYSTRYFLFSSTSHVTA